MIQAKTRQQTEAIVLRLLDYGESDRIVTFSTADFGKIRGIAKGARRSRKRFTNALEPFCHSRMIFSRKNPDSLAKGNHLLAKNVADAILKRYFNK